MKLEFRLLGDIAVLADGQPLQLGGTRQRSVLALLLLQRNRPIATELLADRLWPDDQPLTAIKTVQVYVSRIRHALGPAADRLISSATGYRLAVADDELDAARFERGLRQAREALAAGSSGAALTGLEEALAQWSGPALGDLAGEQFARREAERLEELRLQTHEELFELRIAAGSERETIGELRRLVGEQPGRERLWRLLMLALYADGRQGEALEVYQDARRYLVDELGLDPSPELRDLERAILTQEAPRPTGPSIAEVPAGASVDPIAGRSRRVVSVLRADVVRPADDALDPERLEALDRQALQVVRRAVERHGGTIDWADQAGVTAVFGLTFAREDDALRAVRAAYELLAADVAFRVGVATGHVLTGPHDEQGPSLTGAPLGVAARLAARAAPAEILLATETEQLVRGATTTESVPAGKDDQVTGSSAVRLVALTDADAIVRRTSTPFVGRAAELDSLIAVFDRVVSEGTPGLVTIMGAPGVGKSRLVAESLSRIAKRARVLRSRCLPYGDGITYWPVRELIFAAVGIGPGDPSEDGLSKIEAMVAEQDRADLVSNRVATVVGFTNRSAPTEEIRWAVRRFFEALASQRPLVLLVDDLQWAEPVLVELLEHVLDLGRGPILLITVARPELEELRPDWLVRSTSSLIHLEALNESEAAALLDHLAPDLPARKRERILTTTEGNALFVEQFVAYVSDEADAAGPMGDDQPADALRIPPTIGALLTARLDRLPDPERRLLERAAVIGRTFWTGALTELLPKDERDDLPRRLARLARRELIRPERSDFLDNEAYRFRHLLIRDAAYSSLPKRERADLHTRFADWLERRSGADPAAYDLILGYHLEQAYRYSLELGEDAAYARKLADRALAYIGPASVAAREREDPHAAASILRRAVELSLPGSQRAELLLDLDMCLWTVGEHEAADAAQVEASTLLAEYPDEGLGLRLRLTMAMFTGVTTLAEADDAYNYYERIGDGLGMIRALRVAQMINSDLGRFGAALELVDQATALALEIGRPDRAAQFIAGAAWMLQDGPIPIPEALERTRRYLDLPGNNRGTTAELLMVLGGLEARTVVGNDWRRHFDAAKATIDELGLVAPFRSFIYPRSLGETELAAGDPSRTVELLRGSCSTLDRLGDWGHLASIAPLTAQTLLAVGQLEDVEQFAFWGRDVALVDDLDAQARWRIAVSGLRSRQERHDEAISLARESAAFLAGSEAVVLLAESNLALAGALRAAGDESAALTAARESQQLAAAKQDQAALGKIEAFLGAEA